MTDRPRRYRVALVATAKNGRRKALVRREVNALDGDEAWLQVRHGFRRAVRLLDRHGIPHAVTVEPLQPC